MKSYKKEISIYIYAVILFFLLVTTVGYNILLKNIELNHEKDTKLLFCQIKSKTSDILSKLLHQYYIQKPILIKKHKEVKNILKRYDNILDINLSNISSKINNNSKEILYNIYIADKNLTIQNTTYKPDLGFNLAFAKELFDRHKKEGTIGVCSPLFEKSSKKFLSFTDGYIGKNLLQISYSYPDISDDVKELRDVIDQHKHILDAKAYIVLDTGHINSFLLKDFKPYKESLDEFKKNFTIISNINNKLQHKLIYQKNSYEDYKHLHQIYLATKSTIDTNTNIIYSIIIDETSYYDEIFYLKVLMLFIAIVGTLAIVILNKIREKELRLKYQTNFINNAMHEIITPLNVISLNNELQIIEKGNDEYNKEIYTAVKTLFHSYNDMKYISIQQKNIHYNSEILSLKDIVQDRINYFNSIATANNKILNYTSKGKCYIDISKEEISRLIDNNLSNSIKYSENQTIYIQVVDNILTIKTYGKVIKDLDKIFDKFYRENDITGGCGLGLNIVYDITKKYNISRYVKSTSEHGTIFKYNFICIKDKI